MKRLIILGGGTAGTMLANHLSKKVPHDELSIILIDINNVHYYQPGFLFIPFGIYSEGNIFKPRRDFIPGNVEFIIDDVQCIEPDHNRVVLNDGKKMNYDFLAIATGCTWVTRMRYLSCGRLARASSPVIGPLIWPMSASFTSSSA